MRSKVCVLVPAWWKTPQEAKAKLGSYPIFTVGRFNHYIFLWEAVPHYLRVIRTMWFYISVGLKIHRQKCVQAIMCYGTNWNGVAAVILKWLTGAKLIAEIPGVPHDAFIKEVQHPNLGVHFFKHWCANRLLLSLSAKAIGRSCFIRNSSIDTRSQESSGRACSTILYHPRRDRRNSR